MSYSSNGAGELVLRDCAQVGISTGRSANSLRELRELIGTVPDASIYHHFWGRFLLPQFNEPEYNNDFASWAFHSLHDKTLAERLAVVNPGEFASIDDIRAELMDIIEQRLDEAEMLAWRQVDHNFYFMRGQIVVFETKHKANSPEELREALEHISSGSIFYHFIDARRRTAEHHDDFSIWLRSLHGDYSGLAEMLSGIDPYFSSLNGVRRNLIKVLDEFIGGADERANG